MVKILQINANRRLVTHDLAAALAAKLEMDFITISEPNIKKCDNNQNVYCDINKSAVIINSSHLQNKVLSYYCGNCFVCVEVNECYIYCCYISPNLPYDVFITYLTSLGSHVQTLKKEMRNKGKHKRIIVAGDLNAKHIGWGGQTTDRRGETLMDWSVGMELFFLNQGDTPTLVRHNGSSHIDVTMVNEKITNTDFQWEVLDEEPSMSDHRFIRVEVPSTKRTKKVKNTLRTRGLTDLTKCQELFRNLISEGEDISEHQCGAHLQAAYKNSTPMVKSQEGKMPFWWNVEIQTQILLVKKLRRQMQRETEEETRIAKSLTYKKGKTELKHMIKRSKKEKWREVCNALDHDIFGDGYKIIRRQLNIANPKTHMSDQESTEIFKSLFITEAEKVPSRFRRPCPDVLENRILISEDDLLYACKKIKTGKAPGPDGIPPRVIKHLLVHNGEYFVALFNMLFRQGIFPIPWKTAKLVLIEKQKKKENEIKAYRPICLLNVLGKVFEHIIHKRLVIELEEKGDLHINQFGFRRGRSTIDAVNKVTCSLRNINKKGNFAALTLIDVKNAFNTASWSIIMEKLEKRGISRRLLKVIADYCCDRSVKIGLLTTKTVKGGVPQGSVLGPTLWNVLYDDVMDIDVGENAEVVCYADDLAIITEGFNKVDLKIKIELALMNVDQWMGKNGLKVAMEKTSLTIFGHGKNIKNFHVKWNEIKITPTNECKYLGIILDKTLSFGSHIRRASEKTIRTIRALKAIIPNTHGPNEGKRRMLAYSIQSMMTYGAPVWAESVKAMSNKNILRKTQRPLAIGVTRAYCTVSTEALLVLAGMKPLDFLAEEHQRRYQNKRHGKNEDAESITMEKWQKEWDDSKNGRWTHRLIRNIELCRNRKHGQLTFELTEALSGHGSFAKYLNKIGKQSATLCQECRETEGDAEHTLFICKRWESRRKQLVNDLECVKLDTTNMVDIMLESENGWNSISEYVGEIMRVKFEAEITNNK